MRATTPARNLAPQPEKKKAKTASKKKDKKEGKGEAKIPKNRTDILGEQFSANNIANPRITVWIDVLVPGVPLIQGSLIHLIGWGSSRKGVKLGILAVVNLCVSHLQVWGC